jgi:chromosome segregation protein
MNLTRLELSGFKSFADTVTLSFGEGVTAIVGPNGCGKSNVSDAVRWVLGEQSARLLRGGKMEDVIFQGAAGRRPVNVTEVSLFLDNSDGDLPIAYQEVQITRRLSRSGQSDYLLNGAPVRLRDIQDLLRGTGLGSDAGVVIEAKMIDLLLSDRAEERRQLFEEAAGIGLYRDRRQTTERRLEETGIDLQRVEDLIAEVQSQLRSLARQRGRAERHVKLTEERFAVQMTLARRLLDQLAVQATASEARRDELAIELPAAREAVTMLEQQREDTARNRTLAEAQRTEIARLLGAARLEHERLESDVKLAAERMTTASARRTRATEELDQAMARAQSAGRERTLAADEHKTALGDEAHIRTELEARAATEQEVRTRLADQRQAVRQLEEALQQRAQSLRSLEGERGALEGDLAALREQAHLATVRRASLESDAELAEHRRSSAASDADRTIQEARRIATEAERARHLVGETRRREALDRAERRSAEETLAQLTARRQALEELERDRVGLAPGAAALLAARDQFGGAVLGPLSDFLHTTRDEAELAERLLGEWVHAVLVQDDAAVTAIQAWHAEAQPGALVLLPADRPPARVGDAVAMEDRLKADPPAEPWVRGLLSGAQVLEPAGRALRRPNGAVFLAGASTASGPLRRRAELESLATETAQARKHMTATEAALQATVEALAQAERALERINQEAEEARDTERQAVGSREEAIRLVGLFSRELTDAESQLASLTERVARAERRLAEIDAGLTESELARARLEEHLGEARARLAALESEQEAARDARVHWQVQQAHVAARLEAASSQLARATAMGTEADGSTQALQAELGAIDRECATLAAQQAQWIEARSERRVGVLELEASATDSDAEAAAAEEALTVAEHELAEARTKAETLTDEAHRLELELAETAAQRRSIVERVEGEWRKPIADLLAEAPVLDLELEALEMEAARIVSALEAIGPVNALAVEEHAEETKRHEFLVSQRNDLVAARQSLQQAIREIDDTARAMFMETFTSIQTNFVHVFQTLFGGGECELRLADPENPLESEIDIHAAPRGKRTQRIHLLSSGERTLVAVSLLFSIYLTKPSPFCLMDEVDAPLDDANVARFTRLLDEFKKTTQFIVITHNPRTMQAADAVFGVTMQEPGVSTIVGVRLAEVEEVAA